MKRRERLIAYIRQNFDAEFEPDQGLIGMLDSVSLLQMIMFIDQELGITLDLSQLSVEMFTSIDTVVEGLEAIKPE